MAVTCTRCDGTGFLNMHQIPDNIRKLYDLNGDVEMIIEWIADNEDHDVQVCDCCGNGENWHGVPGEHYNSEDPRGEYGPYAYNGGLCECN